MVNVVTLTAERAACSSRVGYAWRNVDWLKVVARIMHVANEILQIGLGERPVVVTICVVSVVGLVSGLVLVGGCNVQCADVVSTNA